MNKFLVSLAIGLLGANVFAATALLTLQDGSAVHGTAKFVSDDAGTATLTVDAVASAVTGDLTADDINMSGAVSDSIGFNDTQATTVTGLTATVNFANITGAGVPTDYVQFKYFTIDNDSSESIDWAYWNYVIDDETTNTEDSAAELWIQINGTATKALDVDATGINVDGLQVDGNIAASVIDANSYTVDAGAGLDNQAAGTLVLGASTATKVEVADTGVETEVQGGLQVMQGLILPYSAQTGTLYTNTANDQVVTWATTAVSTNVLPEASTVLGSVFTIALQSASGNLEVLTDGTDTFDGTNNKITLGASGSALTVIATANDVYTIINVGDTVLATLTTQ